MTYPDELASRLGVSVHAIYAAIRRGRLAAKKVRGRWMIAADAARKYATTRLGPGRPRKQRG